MFHALRQFLFILFIAQPLYCTATKFTNAEYEYIHLADAYKIRGDTQKAIAWYQQALAINPHNSYAKEAIAQVTQPTRNDMQSNQQASPTAQEINTLYAYAYTCYTQGKEEEAIASYKKILQTHPNIPEVLHNIAYLLKSRGEFSEALTYYNRLLDIKPNHSDARQGRSHALLALGDYEHAWEDFEHRWTKPRPDSKQFTEYMHTHNNDLRGKTVLVKSEFGFGDTLQFIRYAACIKSCGARVIAAIQKQLVPLLSYCPYLDQVIAVDTQEPPHGLETVLMSLPWAFKTTIETIPNTLPYLHADPALIAHWKKYLAKDTNFKIGICWHGNAYTTQNLKKLVDTKSIPLALLASLGEIPGVSLYSLQKTSGLDELKTLPEHITVHTFDNDFDATHGPFMDTAAIMKNLDLIITIDTSIVHLAGGLGVPTWLMLSRGADWRWHTNRDDSPWYPGMRLFRQPQMGDWNSVIENVITALQTTIKKHMPLQPSNPTDINTCFKDGIKQVESGNLEQALINFEHVATRCPRNQQVLYTLAGCYRRMGTLEEAAKNYELVLTLNPEHTDASFGLALVRHTQGDMETGWQLFNLWRKDINTLPKDPAQLVGKTVLIKAEWGLGDMINFIRYAQEIKKLGAHVYVQSHKPLVQLLSRCPYIDKIIPHGTALPEADFQLPVLYLPTLFKTVEKTVPNNVPYLYPDPQLVGEWRDKMQQPHTLHVGICWDMGHYDTNLAGWKRAIPLEYWHTLLRTKNITFYNLQKDGNHALEKLPTDISVHQFGPDFDTTHGGFMDSAAVIKNLDLVITVDTAIAHLAGALGVPTWVMLPYHTDYRWMRERTDTPWYPTMRLFRSQEPDNWQPVLQQVTEKLEKISLHKQEMNRYAPYA